MKGFVLDLSDLVFCCKPEKASSEGCTKSAAMDVSGIHSPRFFARKARFSARGVHSPRSSLHEGVLSQEDAKCRCEVFCQGKSHSRISLEDLRLESVAVNARRDASTSAVPLSYLSISNRINMLCAAGGNDAFSLSFPLGNSNCAVDRAQSIIERASRAGLCA